MSVEILEIGGIKLNAPASWKFQPLENLIFATRDQGVGILQIVPAFRHEIDPQAEHSDILKLALGFAGLADSSEADTLHTNEEGPVRSGSFSQERVGGVSVYWYRLMPQGLILAAYKAEKSQDTEEKIRNEIEECNTLVNSIQYPESAS